MGNMGDTVMVSVGTHREHGGHGDGQCRDTWGTWGTR